MRTQLYRSHFLAFDAHHQQQLAALTREPGIRDAVEQLLGPDLLAWNTHWFVKMPGDKTFISWHQDGAWIVPGRRKLTSPRVWRR